MKRFVSGSLALVLATSAVAFLPGVAEALTVKDLTLRYDQVVYGDGLEAGNGVIRCPLGTEDANLDGAINAADVTASANCVNGNNRTDNAQVNDSFNMQYADIDGDATTYNSSTARLTIPTGAIVDFARLYWAGSAGTVQTNAGTVVSPACQTGGSAAISPPGNPLTQAVKLKLNNGAYANITPTETYIDPTPLGNNNYQTYSAQADVLPQLLGAPSGAALNLTVGNIWAPRGRNCFGGWSLVVVYKYLQADPVNAPGQHEVFVYDGHIKIRAGEGDTTTISGFKVASGVDKPRVGIVAYEGDNGIAGDTFSVNGTAIAEPLTGSTTNFFISNSDSASNPSVINNYSTDSKKFDLPSAALPPGSTTANIAFGTTGDSYLAQTLWLSVPIPSLAITKIVDHTEYRAGDTVTFTIAVTDPTAVAATNVIVTDAAFPACNRNIGNLAGNTTVTYTCTGIAPAADVTNIAKVSGTAGTDTLTGSAAAVVHIVNPAVTLTKTADQPGYRPGQTVQFTLKATNSGDITLTAVTITDPTVPGCARTFASLAPGASQTWLCTTTAPVAGSQNVATVVAQDPTVGRDANNTAVTATATAPAPTINPAITITKSASPSTAQPGQTVTFTLVVTNTGDSPLTGVTVTDAASPSCNTVIGALAAGATQTITCSRVAGNASFVNSASVTGNDIAGQPVTSTGTAPVTVIHPAISLTKTASPTLVRPGDTVTFTIIATNTGDTPLAPVTITDPAVPACASTIASLAAGASTTITCTTVAPSADFANTASVSGTPSSGPSVTTSATATVQVQSPSIGVTKVANAANYRAGDTVTFTIAVTNTGNALLTNVNVTDAVAPGCNRVFATLAVGATQTFTCTMVAPANSVLNTVNVVGTPPVGPNVSAAGQAQVTVVHPGVLIAKIADQTQVREGQAVVFTITVVNSGDIALTNLNVTDPSAPVCGRVIPSLAAGATTSYTCSVVAGASTFTNVVNVSATAPAGGPVTSTDSQTVTVQHPSVSVVKTVAGGPFRPGDVATFTVTATNTGDVTLTNVRVTDPVVAACAFTVASLAPGASQANQCLLTMGNASVTNQATVRATPPVGSDVTNQGSVIAPVIHPAITIVKTASPTTVRAGDTVTFTLLVTNTGDTALTGITTNDPQVTSCSLPVPNLAAGANATVTCSYLATSNDLVNVVSVSGIPPVGPAVTDSSSATVNVIHPGISLSKSVSPSPAVTGQTVTYTITATNTGDVPLTNIAITDPSVPTCNKNVAGPLAAGATVVSTCTFVAPSNTFANTATVTANAPFGSPVTNTASARLDVVTPILVVTKSASPLTARPGDPVTWTITIDNQSPVGSPQLGVTSIQVSDPAVAACIRNAGVLPDLAPGQQTTYTCNAPAPLSSFTNQVTVSALPNVPGPNPPPVVATGSGPLLVVNPALTVNKSVSPSPAHEGDTVTWSLSVTNSGDSTLTNVTATDTAVPSCSRTPATLPALASVAAGVTVSWTCTSAAPSDDLANTINATATDATGHSVSDSDVAFLDVIHPSITLAKTVDSTVVRPGDTVTFTVVVTNNGDVPLTTVAISDPSIPGCAVTVPSLAVGASTTKTCTAVVPAGGLTNTATVTAKDPIGSTVTANDSQAVTTISPAITITKTTSTPVVLPGDTVSFQLIVTNTGNATLTSVVVSDPTAPGCQRTFASLAPGATQTINCTMIAGSSTFTNTADVVGVPPSGPVVTSSSSALVTVTHPAIKVTKTGSPTEVLAGDTVTFTILVTNTGDTTLTGITVTDATAPSCFRAIGTLAAGASSSYTCTLVAGSSTFTNTANVTGTPPVGPAVTGTGSSTITVDAPGFSVTKVADAATYVAGDTVTFTITVTNTGNVALTNVTTSDAFAASCNRVIASLAAGATSTFTCTMVAPANSIVNTVLVTATAPVGPAVTGSGTAPVTVIHPAITVTKSASPSVVRQGDVVTFTIVVTNTGDAPLTGIALTDALVPGCGGAVVDLAAGASATKTCTWTAGATDLTNTVSVTGTASAGPAVTDTATATVTVTHPAITITKTGSPVEVVAGATVTFTILVKNTGDVALTGVTVSDPSTASCARAIGTLAAGATSSYTCTVVAGTADFTNTANVTGTPPVGPAVTGTDSATIIVDSPAIKVTKVADAATYVAGETVTLTITVTNTGNVALTNVTTSDAFAASCNRVIASLAAGATSTFTCTMVAPANSIVNTVLVTATAPVGPAVTGSGTAPVTVIHPAITVTKSASPSVVRQGDVVTFTIVVTNTGDAPLTGIALTDAAVPGCGGAVVDLAAGASATKTCTWTAGATDLTNTVSVTGTASAGPAVTDTATATVTVTHPAITITKTGSPVEVVAGGTVTFTILVKNTGDVALTGVTVSDPSTASCARAIGTLAAGASSSYTCTVVAGTADFTNTANVTGTPPVGPAVTGTDSATIIVDSPAIKVTKVADAATYVAGETVTFTIVVTNTGDVTLTNVKTTDVLSASCNKTIASLAAGATSTFTCTMVAPSSSIVNHVSVVGTPPVGPSVTGGGDAPVTVIHPAITVTKTASPTVARQGDVVTFTIVVTNTGDAPLTGIALTDALVPGCGGAVVDLAAGASATKTCTWTAGASDLTNTVSVTGTPTAGPAVTDTATATVNVIHPSVALAKSVTPTPAVVGQTVTYTVTVINTGDVPLTNLVVTDPLVPACAGTIAGPLAPGASSSLTCTDTAASTTFVNTANVSADPPFGAVVTATGSAQLDVVVPSLLVTKSVAPTTARAGDPIVWTITIQNTSPAGIPALTLTNVAVSDPAFASCTRAVGVLADIPSGATVSYTCAGVAPVTTTTNTVVVTGKPNVPGPGVPVVTGTGTGTITIVNPGLAVTKSVSPTLAHAGDAVTWTITVTNTGDSLLTDVSVTDALVPSCDRDKVSLPDLATVGVGVTATWTCTSVAPANDQTNTILGAGTDVTGNPVSASATATLDVIHPGIAVTKTVSAAVVQAGTSVTFTVTVTNTGDVTLTNVVITDVLVPGCSTTLASLASGASSTKTCTAIPPTAGISNTVSVSADDPLGVQVAGTGVAAVSVISPKITLTKTTSTPVVQQGDTIKFQLIVTNTGDVDLTNVVVSDPLASSCNKTIAKLVVGQVVTINCTMVAGTTSVHNVATVTGRAPVGPVLTATGVADVRVNRSEPLPHTGGTGLVELISLGLMLLGGGLGLVLIARRRVRTS